MALVHARLVCLSVLQARSALLQQQLETAESDLNAAHANRALLVNQLKPVQKSLAAANKAHAEAELAAQRCEVRICLV